MKSAINIYYREPLPGLKEWIDSEANTMWSLQDSSYRAYAQKWQNSGIIDGDHCDGNFARTSIMYCLWKTQGVLISPWREDVVFGAVRKNNELYITIKADTGWQGRIIFDTQRHKNNLKLPIDWPRINQFPEWFPIDQQSQYNVEHISVNSTTEYSGSELKTGLFLKLDPGINYKLKVVEL